MMDFNDIVVCCSWLFVVSVGRNCHVVHVFDENDEVDDELIVLLVVAVLMLEF